MTHTTRISIQITSEHHEITLLTTYRTLHTRPPVIWISFLRAQPGLILATIATGSCEKRLVLKVWIMAATHALKCALNEPPDQARCQPLPPTPLERY